MILWYLISRFDWYWMVDIYFKIDDWPVQYHYIKLSLTHHRTICQGLIRPVQQCILSIYLKPTVGIDFLTRNISFKSTFFQLKQVFFLYELQIKLTGYSCGILPDRKSTRVLFLRILEMQVVAFSYLTLWENNLSKICPVGSSSIAISAQKNQSASF